MPIIGGVAGHSHTQQAGARLAAVVTECTGIEPTVGIRTNTDPQGRLGASTAEQWGQHAEQTRNRVAYSDREAAAEHRAQDAEQRQNRRAKSEPGAAADRVRNMQSRNEFALHLYILKSCCAPAQNAEHHRDRRELRA